jgi:hypothetical protein
MTSRVSGDLVYWNAHTRFGEIDLDDRRSRAGIYRADLLRAGIRTPQVGDRFHLNTGIAASGTLVAIDLCLDVGEPTRNVEAMHAGVIQVQMGPKFPEYPDD